MAILTVIFVHAFQSSFIRIDAADLPGANIIYQGVMILRYCVELFFVLSGWLIFALYYRKDAHAYWPRRAARLLPLWIVFSIAALAIVTFTPWRFVIGQLEENVTVPFWLGLILIIPFLGWFTATTWNVPPGGWSIQVEAGHYIGFWFLRRRGLVSMLMSVLVGYATYFAASWIHANSSDSLAAAASQAWLRLGLYGTWPFFLAGGIAYLLSSRREELKKALQWGRSSSRALIMSLCGLIVVTAFWIPVPFGKTMEAVLGVVLLAFLTWLCVKSTVLTKILVSLGNYSYFMYFGHFWFITIFSAALVWGLTRAGVVDWPAVAVSWVGTFALTLPVTWLLGRYSWRFFEEPFIDRVRRLTARSQP
jgi:peptidoglycan/LPS O-acetylase OafA/YrhL